MSQNIKIQYSDDEYGWAEPLGGRLARIDNNPLTDQISKNDIVRISPAGKSGYPKIVEIVFQRHPCRTDVYYANDDQLYVLLAHLKLTDSECFVLAGPKDGRPGIIVVAHHEYVDPELLAKAIGLKLPESPLDSDGNDDGIPVPENEDSKGIPSEG